MSDRLDGPPGMPSPPTSEPAAQQRNGCLTAFMVLAGIIMLLPGLCALFFGLDNFGASQPDPVVSVLVLVGLAIAAGGIFLIWRAIRGPRSG